MPKVSQRHRKGCSRFRSFCWLLPFKHGGSKVLGRSTLGGYVTIGLYSNSEKLDPRKKECRKGDKNSKSGLTECVHDFPYHLKKIIVCYKKIGYNIDILRQIFGC